MNPRLGRLRASSGIFVGSFFKPGRRHVEPAVDRLGLTPVQAAEIQNAVAVACGAIAVCAFALRNGFLPAAALDVAGSELDVDEFIWASFFLSVPTALLAHRYHGPVWSCRCSDDEESDLVS